MINVKYREEYLAMVARVRDGSASALDRYLWHLVSTPQFWTGFNLSPPSEDGRLAAARGLIAVTKAVNSSTTSRPRAYILVLDSDARSVTPVRATSSTGGVPSDVRIFDVFADVPITH